MIVIGLVLILMVNKMVVSCIPELFWTQNEEEEQVFVRERCSFYEISTWTASHCFSNSCIWDKIKCESSFLPITESYEQVCIQIEKRLNWLSFDEPCDQNALAFRIENIISDINGQFSRETLADIEFAPNLIPVEESPGEICSSFRDDSRCSESNFCCWDGEDSTCMSPAPIDCVTITEEESCSIVWGEECSWIDEKCQRRSKPSDKKCESAITSASQRPICYVGTLTNMCLPSFIYLGITYTQPVNNQVVSPPKQFGNPISGTVHTKQWCIVSNGVGKRPPRWGFATCTNRKRKRNVLLIICDDMRPEQRSAYSRYESVTPYLDRFVNSPGTVVMGKEYVQLASCAPSRASLFSGLYPDTTRVFSAYGKGLNQDPSFRKTIKTIPQVFREAGYFTAAGGKIFQLGQDDPLSWDRNFYKNSNQNQDCSKDKYSKAILLGGNNRPLVCTTTAPLLTLRDFQLSKAAVSTLNNIVTSQLEPFFLAVGYFRPHSPYQVALPFWNLFENGVSDVARPASPEPKSSYISSLTFSKLEEEGAFPRNPFEATSSIFRQTLRRGYLSALAQTDAAISMIFQSLIDLGIENTTMVIITADHGFTLGENNIFAKNTDFEMAVRVPTFFHIPWFNSVGITGVKRVMKISSHIDLLPTILSLMNLNLPTRYEGIDQSKWITSAIKGIDSSLLTMDQNYAFSQVVRCNGDCGDATKGQMRAIGYSVRTESWRFVIFLQANSSGNAIWKDDKAILSRELYDHSSDPQTIFNFEEGTSYDFIEYENVAHQNSDVCANLFRLIEEQFS